MINDYIITMINDNVITDDIDECVLRCLIEWTQVIKKKLNGLICFT